MKSKKLWLTIAIVFSVIAIGIGSATIGLYIFPVETDSFVQSPTYNDGIVEEVISDESVHTITLKNHNTALFVTVKSIENPTYFSNLKAGDKITFALSPSSQENFDQNKDSRAIVTYLACENEVIVSLESYENSVSNDANISHTIGLIVSIISVIICLVSYVQYFRLRKLGRVS